MASNIADTPRIVIIGGGFGGLTAARALAHARARITLVDRSNHHLFQPLLYQVATAGLSATDIAAPIRSVLRKQLNTEALLAEVTGVDVAGRRVLTADRALPYDYLVVATGSTHSYFGHDEWSEVAPGLKSIADATRIRRRILLAFEAAEMERDEARRRALLRFVIVGGGPTGVELAGAIAELSHHALAADFRRIDPRQAEIILIEAGSRPLATFPEALSEAAARELARLGVQVRPGQRVSRIDADGVSVGETRIDARTVIWAAGVRASPAGEWLGAAVDRVGRIIVTPRLTVPGHEEIFVIGDTATLSQDGHPLPGVAPVAMQQGRYVAGELSRRLAGGAAEAGAPFRYRDKGNLATVGRRFAVVEIGRLRLKGLVAWLLWIVVHIYYLIGFRNRVVVLLEWAWAYVTFQRGARLISEPGNGHVVCFDNSDAAGREKETRR